ncbi:MAG: tRNA (adenosine(37)-N6)-threonylcarbamoyltransferase complex ATPase subunit type 1 TsaE [Defluviitaleaceae bacterium]|nr:tRNA (adenosine(37)-N6)-threonylcarbamoyltransferase complex ATPase subunit type 1 TsaE [Defluviitaleaceae bacterium]
MICESYSAEDTENLGFILGQEAKKGDIFCLSGNLGAGKTVFTQGFAKGLGYEGRVTSPTFTLMNEYVGGRFPIYHFDLYRLEGGEEDLESIGYEDYFYGNGVALVEWAELAGDAIPKDAIWVKIAPDLEKDPDYRDIVIGELNEYISD